MTEQDEEKIEFIWAYPPDVEKKIAEGWKVAEGWMNAGHHLRYVFPLWRRCEN